MTRLAPTPRSVTTESCRLGGVPAEVYRPRRADSGDVLLYLHGGGYTTGSPRTHRGLASRLGAALNATTYSIDYRLAPEHPYPAAFTDVKAAYDAVAAQATGRVFVAGDSAGGGLALALSLWLSEQGRPTPAVLGLICPASDGREDTIDGLAHRSRDAILTRRLVHRFFQACRTGADLESPAISPILGELRDLPPIVIHSASNDLIVDCARELDRSARAAGVRVRYLEFPGKWHVFHILAGLWSAADHAIDALARDMLAEAAVFEEAA